MLHSSFSHFVPNLTIGAPVVKSLRKSIPKHFFDCHLMVQEPEKMIDDFAEDRKSTRLNSSH